MQPEAAQVILWQHADALIALESALQECRIMKAGKQREIIHRIAADHIVEVNERGDLIAGAEDVPEREVFVDEAALRKIEQCPVILDLGSDPFSVVQKTASDEEMKMLVEAKAKVVEVGGVVAMQGIIQHAEAR